MNEGISVLDEALGLARQEISALDKGEYETAVDMAARRGELVSRAWNMLDSCNRELYHKRLLELSTLHDQLVEKARNAQAAVRERLGRSRLERQRMKGYHLAVSHALQ